MDSIRKIARMAIRYGGVKPIYEERKVMEKLPEAKWTPKKSKVQLDGIDPIKEKYSKRSGFKTRNKKEANS